MSESLHAFLDEIVTADELRRNEDELTELLATGRITPHVAATFDLDDVAAALRHVADGRAVGKVVLDVTDRARSGSTPAAASP